MALTIKYTPALKYISAHEDVVYVVYEDTKPYDSTTYPDYKYVCDISIVDANGVESVVARIKSYPRPNDKLGIFNIGNVVRSYLFTRFSPALGQIRSNEFGPDEFYVQVICRFGEEYNFATYPAIIVDSQRSFFNNYNGRQKFGTNTILPNYLDKVISNRPYQNTVRRECFNYFIPFLSSDDTAISLEVRAYNKSLGFIRQRNFSINPTALSTDRIQQLNACPNIFNIVSPGTIDAIVDYYTITLNTTNIINDSVYRFDIVCESKYESFPIHFMNKFGGFETKEFHKVSRRTYDIERSSFKRTSYQIDSNGNVNWFNSTSQVYNEQNVNFATQFGEKLQLNSDLLQDQEYIWLGELIMSTQAYVEYGGYFYPIVITDTNYEERKIINDKLTNLTLNIQFADTFNAQYR